MTLYDIVVLLLTIFARRQEIFITMISCLLASLDILRIHSNTVIIFCTFNQCSNYDNIP